MDSNGISTQRRTKNGVARYLRGCTFFRFDAGGIRPAFNKTPKIGALHATTGRLTLTTLCGRIAAESEDPV